MTGMAAIAFCAAFTSCSKDENLYNEEQIRQNEASQIVDEYNKAFIAAFGQPAADQAWGFKGYANAGTRSENANANEWADPTKEYGGLKVPPAITSTQAAVVKTYFQTHDKLGYQDPGWSNYFIQQVYKGHTDVPEGCATPEAYLAANGSTYIIASDHMDHLIAVDKEKGIEDHINNFNHGDCSSNSSVLTWSPDYVSSANTGPFHTDKIMYMQNSTTKSFGYHNSDGSLYHTEYTGLVGWKTIHDWAVTNYPSYDGCLNDGWNRSYMGFDFEQMVGDDVYAAKRDYVNRNESNNWQGELVITYEDYHYFTFDGVKYHYLDADRNMYAADLKEESYKQKNGSNSTIGGVADFSNVPSNDVIRDLLDKGYLPVIGSADKVWVKVGGTADGYFSDWIVTLTKANTGHTPDPNVVRIIAEDLSISSDPTKLKGDFDFNDVVFDVTFNDDKSVATIQLVAAGGVLPLTVAGVEVHQAFGQSRDMSTGWYPMINTGGIAQVNGATAASFTYNNPGENGINIPVLVNKFTKNADGTFTDNWIELEAKQGQCPAKLCVNQTFEYCEEREPIDSKYTGFQSWVQGNKYIWW